MMWSNNVSFPGYSIFLVALMYMVAILMLSSVPGDISDDSAALQVFLWVPPTLQNLLHVPVYAGLAFVWCRGLEPRLRRPAYLYAALLITVLFGILDEWYQSHIPGRFASISDVINNALGALLGVGAFVWIATRQDR